MFYHEKTDVRTQITVSLIVASAIIPATDGDEDLNEYKLCSK